MLDFGAETFLEFTQNGADKNIQFCEGVRNTFKIKNPVVRLQQQKKTWLLTWLGAPSGFTPLKQEQESEDTVGTQLRIWKIQAMFFQHNNIYTEVGRQISSVCCVALWWSINSNSKWFRWLASRVLEKVNRHLPTTWQVSKNLEKATTNSKRVFDIPCHFPFGELGFLPVQCCSETIVSKNLQHTQLSTSHLLRE